MVFGSYLEIFRRRERLAVFGLTPRDPLPVAAVRFRTKCTHPRCAGFAAANAECLQNYRKADKWSLAKSLKKTAAVTDLRLFPDFEKYADAVSKETNGKYRRSANRATREGLFTRQITPGAYQRSLYDIKNSMATRSLGAMPRHSGGLYRPQQDIDVERSPPTCVEHWRIDWGLFNQADETMWGFASLIRSGNLVRLDHMIAHGDVLSAGGMKLLQFDLMKWLLGRADPWTLDIEHLVHGAIEDGGDGIAKWRRYVIQRPHLLRFESPERVTLPSDFDSQAYLEFNPDVRAARCDPRDHYLRHGALEGRRYR